MKKPAIIAAALLVAAIFTLSGFYVPRTSADPVEHSITIPDNMKTCTKDEDCALISTHCNGCCHFDSVHIDAVKAVEDMWQKTCEGYKGPVCDCDNPVNKPVCQEGRCTLVHRGW